MAMKYYYFILVIMLMLSSSLSQNNGFNSPWLQKIQPAKKLATTLAPETVHLDMKEKSYSTEEKVKYINECVRKCLDKGKSKFQKTSAFDLGRDNCIELECQIYERRR